MYHASGKAQTLHIKAIIGLDVLTSTLETHLYTTMGRCRYMLEKKHLCAVT
jgi:hypothetical protein